RRGRALPEPGARLSARRDPRGHAGAGGLRARERRHHAGEIQAGLNGALSQTEVIGMSLRGKVAVVTGAGSGIGRAIAVQLAADGAAVAVWDLNRAGAEETVVDIEKAGGRAISCAIDASSEEDIAGAAEGTRAELGPVTILVNNAGITGFCAFLDIAVEAWDRMIAVNLRGPFL